MRTAFKIKKVSGPFAAPHIRPRLGQADMGQNGPRTVFMLNPQFAHIGNRQWRIVSAYGLVSGGPASSSVFTKESRYLVLRP
jgi:hypothetical protein